MIDRTTRAAFTKELPMISQPNSAPAQHRSANGRDHLSVSATAVAVKALAELLWPSVPRRSGQRDEDDSGANSQLALVKELLRSNIDPELFDSIVSNEMDRRLKVRFGICFLLLTFLFTAASYAIVAANGVCGWGISSEAITVLLIETPLQFIGLLYVIARNLFPERLRNVASDASPSQPMTESPPSS
jgi:hypothetical protein